MNSQKELGRSSGSDSSTCSRSSGQRKRWAEKLWSHDEKKALKKMAGKAPRSEIAETLGKSPASVSNMAIRLGISLKIFGENNPVAKHPNTTVEKVRRMRDAGCGYGYISKKTGVSEWTVKAWCDFKIRTNDPVTL